MGCWLIYPGLWRLLKHSKIAMIVCIKHQQPAVARSKTNKIKAEDIHQV
jgi:hypothetical protein